MSTCYKCMHSCMEYDPCPCCRELVAVSTGTTGQLGEDAMTDAPQKAKDQALYGTNLTPEALRELEQFAEYLRLKSTGTLPNGVSSFDDYRRREPNQEVQPQ